MACDDVITPVVTVRFVIASHRCDHNVACHQHHIDNRPSGSAHKRTVKLTNISAAGTCAGYVWTTFRWTSAPGRRTCWGWETGTWITSYWTHTPGRRDIMRNTKLTRNVTLGQ
eukprot:1184277-Prorocentrum_minimum.AAC.3